MGRLSDSSKPSAFHLWSEWHIRGSSDPGIKVVMLLSPHSQEVQNPQTHPHGEPQRSIGNLLRTWAKDQNVISYPSLLLLHEMADLDHLY